MLHHLAMAQFFDQRDDAAHQVARLCFSTPEFMAAKLRLSLYPAEIAYRMAIAAWNVYSLLQVIYDAPIAASDDD